MTIVELEQVIRDYVFDVYNMCFTGKIIIRELNPIGYDVALCFSNNYKPVHIAAQLPLDDYLKYFKEELRNRHFDSVHWYTGYQTLPYDK